MTIETRIVSHHVGGRGFEVALKVPFRFRDDILHVVYEADPACADEMARAASAGVHVAPYCLAASDGSATLNVTVNPFFSSLLEPDPAFAAATCEVALSGVIDGVPVEGARYDAAYAGEIAVARRVPVATRALDSLLADGVLPDGAPDFLSLDTQGTELDILHGAERALRSVVAFSTEIEFRPMYRGQALFSDILAFARAHGFEFAGFTHLQGISATRLPVGARGRDETAFGDALFFRTAESIAADASADVAHLMALKLAFLAVCFEHLGVAARALRQAAATPPSAELQVALTARGYPHFLGEFAAAINHGPQLHDDRAALTAEIAAGRRLPWHTRIGRAVGALVGGAPATGNVERLLRANDFVDAAATVRHRRRAGERYVAGAVRHLEPPPSLMPLLLHLYKLPPVRGTYRFLRRLVTR